MRSHPRRNERWLALTLGVVLTCVLAEALLRVWARGSDPVALLLRRWDPHVSPIVPLGDSCFRQRPGASFHYDGGVVAHANAMGFRGPEVVIPKPEGTFRVVLLGGSTAHGFGVDDESTIDARLRDWIAARHPSVRIEVVNRGFYGLDGACDEQRLRLEGLSLDPDAVILHTGINDVAVPTDSAARPDLAGAPRKRLRAELDDRARGGVWASIKHTLFVARLPGVARHLLARPDEGPAGSVLTPGQAADRVEGVLRKIADLVPAGAPLLLSSPPSALRWPDSSAMRPTDAWVGDAATTQRYRDSIDERLRLFAERHGAADRPIVHVPHDVPRNRFLDDCHLDGEGNRLVAEDLGRVLEPWVASGRSGSHPSGDSSMKPRGGSTECASV